MSRIESSVPPAPETVLCIEDDPDTREMLAECLTQDGFLVSTAGTLDEANHALELMTFDLIVTDYELPDGDGTSFIESSLAHDRLRGARVVMITGSFLGRRLADVRCWMKPIDPKTLASRLREVLNEAIERTSVLPSRG